jgi:hypothetical protein
VQEQARNLIERRDATSGGQRTQRHNNLARLLTGFAEEIAAERVLDQLRSNWLNPEGASEAELKKRAHKPVQRTSRMATERTRTAR